MAQRIFVCSHCGNTFVKKAFDRHKYCELTKRCYNLDSDLVDDEDEIIFTPEKKGK